MYEYLKEQKDSVIKEFEKAEIKEVVKSAQDIDTRCENSPWADTFVLAPLGGQNII